MSYRYVDANRVVDIVDYNTQNKINEMDCVYIDGILPNNQLFNLAEHDAKVRAEAIEELLKELCIGCAYLNGTKCEIKGGCPCSIGQSEIIRSANKVLEQLKEQKNE